MMAPIEAGIRVTSFVSDVGVPLTVGLTGVVAAIMAVAASFVFGRWGEASARRRDGYAAATRALVAYAEYPWRVRRRTSDTPEELARLAALGHDLQEALRYHATWVQPENWWVGQVYKDVWADLAVQITSGCNDAWMSCPVSTAAGMCLGDWGPKDLAAHVERFESARAFRFGWRRLLGLLRLHLGVIPRPQPRASPSAVLSAQIPRS
jgi:hypothetical protein